MQVSSYQHFESWKQHTRNTKLIPAAPDDLLRSNEMKRFTWFTTLLPVIQSLRQTGKSDCFPHTGSFRQFVSKNWFNSLICLLYIITQCMFHNVYTIIKAPNNDVKRGCFTCLKHIKWMNWCSSAHLFTKTVTNHKNVHLALHSSVRFTHAHISSSSVFSPSRIVSSVQ